MVIDNLQLLDYEISPTVENHRPVENPAKNIAVEIGATRPHEDVFSNLYS
jgi:hypothetical protein